MNLRRDILDAAERVASRTAAASVSSVVRWGTVTAASPLQVRFDADVDANPSRVRARAAGYTPASGDRVLALRMGRRWVVAFAVVSA